MRPKNQFIMDRQSRYKDFSGFLAGYFPFKVQKLSVNAGFSCPNRDGTKGYGGCTYCNNQTFNPAYCRTEKTIAVQLEEGKQFFSRKYPQMKYLAYFQAYTNTPGLLTFVATYSLATRFIPSRNGVTKATSATKYMAVSSSNEKP